MWDKLPVWFQWVIYALIAFVAFILVKPIIQVLTNLKARLTSNATARKFETSRVEVKDQHTGQQYTINLAEVAANCVDALFNADMFGASEDEQKFVANILQCPANKIFELNKLYIQQKQQTLGWINKNKYGTTSIQQDSVALLDDSSYQKIKHLMI